MSKFNIKVLGVSHYPSYSKMSDEEKHAWETDMAVSAMSFNVPQLRVLRVHNVREFVSSVRGIARRGSIGRLIFEGHGTPEGAEVGDDVIARETLPLFKHLLVLLAGYFTPAGYVHFENCFVGQNKFLLTQLAKLIGVPVYAGTDLENPIWHFNRGGYKVAFPDGRCQDCRRPQYAM